MHRLTHYTEIPKAVKIRVWERDGGRCVLCGTTRAVSPNAHYIPRSALGLGIDERNIFCACLRCHNLYDNSPQRRDIKDRLTGYLSWRYGDNWINDEDELKYHKGMDYVIRQYEYQGGDNDTN